MLLDQFYTNPIISDELCQELLLFLRGKNVQFDYFIEPSAGTGNFIHSMQKNGFHRYKAFDLEPKNRNFKIKKEDFLKKKLRRNPNVIVIGNPPFGKRSKLALEFLNKCLDKYQVVAFILPNQFNRYLTQKLVNPRAKLLFSKQLNEDSFLVADKPYDVNCVFQIWSIFLDGDDFRKRVPPSRKHPDFMSWIHNNTDGTLKYFSKEKYKWDFAVHRQGYYDFSKIIFEQEDLIKNRQYIFVKAHSKESLKILKNIDFTMLSKSNTSTPGFSTTDLVAEYEKRKDEYVKSIVKKNE